MTIEELSKYYEIKMVVKEMQQEIRELEASVIGSIDYSVERVNSSHNGSSKVEEVAFRACKLRDILYDKYLKMLEAQKEIEDFIECVENEEVQSIIRARFILCKSWKDIAKERNYTRTAPYMKLINYLSERKEEKNEDEE